MKLHVPTKRAHSRAQVRTHHETPRECARALGRTFIWRWRSPSPKAKRSRRRRSRRWAVFAERDPPPSLAVENRAHVDVIGHQDDSDVLSASEIAGFHGASRWVSVGSSKRAPGGSVPGPSLRTFPVTPVRSQNQERERERGL